MINITILDGNLTRDAELSATAKGTPMLKFSVANTGRRVDEEGNWVDKPNYVDCVMFGNRATGIAPYLKKGTSVTVQGTLQYSSWTDRETGKTRSKLEISVDDIDLHSRPASAPQAAPVPAGAVQAASPVAAGPFIAQAS